MKKIFLFAAAALVLVSCGGKKDQEAASSATTEADANAVTEDGVSYTLPKTIAIEGNIIPGALKGYVQIDGTELSYTFDADKGMATFTLPVKILQSLDDFERISDIKAEWLDENGNEIMPVFLSYEPLESILKQSKVGKTQFNITFDDYILPEYFSKVKSIIFTGSEVKLVETDSPDIDEIAGMDAYDAAMKQGQDMYDKAMKQGQDMYDKAMKQSQDMYDKAQKDAEEMMKKYGF